MTLYVISLVLLAASLQASSNDLDHKIGNFGDSILTIRNNLEGKCDELSERELSILLDVVKNSQTQLECDGFLYRGQKRFVELMFNDGRLDIIHIMKTESDHEELKDILITEYGKPSFSSDQVDYFLSEGISLRTKPHEISFVSKRVRQQYDDYMRSLSL
jgi:hypothetical protein